MKILVFLTLLGIGLGLHFAAAVTHSLKYFYTVSSGVPKFPEFVAVGLVDEVQMIHYDSNTRRAEPKQDWMSRVTAGKADYWERETQVLVVKQQVFKYNIAIAKQRFNQTGELPSVSLLQKTSSSPVSCHATGFYPDRATMFWRKDGEEIHEDVDHGEILPNNDGSFQMSVDLNPPTEDWEKYECVFQLSGVKNDIVTKLDKAEIRTNKSKTGIRSYEEKLTDIIIIIISIVAAVVVLALILIAVIGFFIYKKKKESKSRSPSKNFSTESVHSDTPLFIESDTLSISSDSSSQGSDTID